MVGRRHLLYLLYTARPPTSSTPFFTPPPPLPPTLFRKEYNIHESSSSKGKQQQQQHAEESSMSHERAPSTLEEFKRLEEEKASQGVASQTVEKAGDGFMEAVAGDDSVDSVKENFKEPPGAGNFRRTGD